MDAKVDTSASDKAAIEKAIKDIKDRMELGESIDKVQNDMLHIHETRLAALELKVTQIDAKVALHAEKIAAAEEGIAVNAQKILDVKAELVAAIEAGDEAAKASLQVKLDALEADQSAKRNALASRVDILEEYKGQLVTADVINKLGSLQTQISDLKTKIEGPLESRIQAIEVLLAAVAKQAELTGDLMGALLVELQATIIGDITDPYAQLEVKSTKLDKLRSDLEGVKSDLLSKEAVLKALINEKSECSFGPRTGGFLNHKQTITCDGVTITVEVP